MILIKSLGLYLNSHHVVSIAYSTTGVVIRMSNGDSHTLDVTSSIEKFAEHTAKLVTEDTHVSFSVF